MATCSTPRRPARRVFKLLDLPEEPQADGALPAPAKGDVRFEHVSFSYDPAVRSLKT